MSKYTTELRYICESYNTDTPSDNDNVEDIIANAAPKIFDFDYPIFDESYRLALESTILRHYYTREICCETVGRWKMFLRDRMILIMPKYNLMYKNLQDIQDKLLFTTDMTEDYKGNGSNTNTNTSSGNSTNRTTGSAKNTSNTTSGATSHSASDAWQTANDTPQGALTGIENNQYLSSATHNKGTSDQNSDSNATGSSTAETTQSVTNESSNTSNGSNNSTQSYVRKLLGKNGGSEYINIYNKLVDSYTDIDELVIEDLSDLFFQLW